MKSTCLVLVASAVALAGCGNRGASNYTPKPAPKVEKVEVKPGEEMSLLPLAEGAQWVYSSEVRLSQKGQTRSTSLEITFRCGPVKDLGDGGKEAVMDIVGADNQVSEKQTWRVDKTGVYQLAGGDKNQPFTPPIPNLVFPIKLGDNIKWKGDGPFPGGVVKGAVGVVSPIGYEELDTDMGRMSGLAVETRMQWKSGTVVGQSYAKTWWRPNYGFIRFRQEVEIGDTQALQIFRLKSYTPGK